MAQVTTDKTTKHSGIPMTPEELADYNKVWTDIEECVAYCYKHPVKLTKNKK